MQRPEPSNTAGYHAVIQPVNDVGRVAGGVTAHMGLITHGAALTRVARVAVAAEVAIAIPENLVCWFGMGQPGHFSVLFGAAVPMLVLFLLYENV